MKKVIFMGTPDYAGVILEELLGDSDIDVCAVFTQPDKPVGRKQILTPPYVKKILLEKKNNIKIYQPNSLKDKSIINIINKLTPDFIIVAAYGQILPKDILQIAPCINLHASLLPNYRGASPIQATLLNDDEITGITAMLMNEGLDTGDILAYSVVKIDKDMIVGELFERLSLSAAKLCITTLKEFEKIKPLEQFGALKSYSKKIKKSDGEISFDNAKDIYKKYKAYTPWPGIYLKNGLKIKKMSLLENVGTFKEGEILEINDSDVTIGCKIGTIVLHRIQPPSKRDMSAKEYITGKRLKIGDRLIINN